MGKVKGEPYNYVPAAEPLVQTMIARSVMNVVTRAWLPLQSKKRRRREKIKFLVVLAVDIGLQILLERLFTVVTGHML